MAVSIDDEMLLIERLRHNKIKLTLRTEIPEGLKKHKFTDGRNTWSIEFHPEGIYLNLEKCVHPIAGYCRLSFFDANRKEVFVGERHFKGKSGECACSFKKCSKRFLINKGEELLSGDRITLFFQIAVVEYDRPSSHQKAACELTEDLENLFTSEELSDVTLCAEGKEFKGHKAILGARSPVFRCMFSNQMKEAKSGRVELTDTSADVLKEMLNFIYTGESVLETQTYYTSWWDKIDQELAIGLLQVSEKYQLDKLKAICEDALADCLSEESIIRILALSCLYRADDLRDQCINFISWHTGAFIKQLVADGSFSKKVLASNPAETDDSA